MTAPTPPERWPTSVAEARAEQLRLRDAVRVEWLDFEPTSATGLDVSYRPERELDAEGRTVRRTSRGRLAAAAVTLDLETGGPPWRELEAAVAHGPIGFPYVPGYLGFRETPILLEAVGCLRIRPQVLICDGHGLAHPRRFGVACHVGVLTDLPTFGVAKNPPPHGDASLPGPRRGDRVELRLEDEVVGMALRTQDDVKPVYVSVGHRIDLEAACELTLRLAPKHRQPETTRRADGLSRASLRESEA